VAVNHQRRRTLFSKPRPLANWNDGDYRTHTLSWQSSTSMDLPTDRRLLWKTRKGTWGDLGIWTNIRGAEKISDVCEPCWNLTCTICNRK